VGKLKAWLFNRKASSRKNKPDEVSKALGLQPGQNIADIGVGGGYFSLRFSEAVGDGGVVYAIDTDQGFLELLLMNAEGKGFKNIKTVPAPQIKSLVPDKSLDLIFLRNVFHHIENRAQYFERLSSKLKAEGKIAIIEYKSTGRFNFHKLFRHYVPQEEIIEEMDETGYTVHKSYDFLPEQSFTIFSLKKMDSNKR